MFKYLITLIITYMMIGVSSSAQARGKKAEIRFDIPYQSNGNNVRRASIEETKSFSSSGYGLEYIFSNEIGLGYRTETVQTEMESLGTVTKKNGVKVTAMELSYRIASERAKYILKRFYLQLGLGSVISGKVLKHESSGNDLLSSYNSTHTVMGSTQFGTVGYSFGFFSTYLGFRIWDVWAYHSDSQKNTMDLGHLNWSSLTVGGGIYF